VRQHVSRARKRLTGEQRAAINSSMHRQLLDAFVAGAQTGDLTALELLFAADVNGGSTYGRLQIAASPTRGRRMRASAQKESSRPYAGAPHHCATGGDNLPTRTCAVDRRTYKTTSYV
jgi:hypothetical protein